MNGTKEQKSVSGDIESTPLQEIIYVPPGKENGHHHVQLIDETSTKLLPDTLFLYFAVLTGIYSFFINRYK